MIPLCMRQGHPLHVMRANPKRFQPIASRFFWTDCILGLRYKIRICVAEFARVNDDDAFIMLNQPAVDRQINVLLVCKYVHEEWSHASECSRTSQKIGFNVDGSSLNCMDFHDFTGAPCLYGQIKRK